MTCVASLLAGCTSAKKPPSTNPAPATRTISPDDPRLADADFWWSQPAHVSVRGDFDPLWSAAERCLKDLFFEIDRRDWRSGVLSTRPLISAQWFEPWRGDVASSHARTSSTLATERRTVRIEFVTLIDGMWEARPRVLVEREAVVERQITSSAMTRGAFSRRSLRGSLEADRGIELPDRYWYAVGRDPALERQLAARMQKILDERADAR
jgi:hypothetical protein